MDIIFFKTNCSKKKSYRVKKIYNFLSSPKVKVKNEKILMNKKKKILQIARILKVINKSCK